MRLLEPDRNQQTAPEARSEQLREAARARMEAERLAREAQQNAAQGDTNIHVNNQPPRQTPPQDQPKLDIPTRPRPGAPTEPTAPARGTNPQQERPQSQQQEAPRRARPDTPRNDVPEPEVNLKEKGPAPRQPQPARRPAQSVNWGNVALTVLKVAAIGLVAFAGAAFLSGFIGTALAALVTVPAVGVAVNSTVSFVGPIGASLANGAAWLGGIVSAAFSGIGAGLGISGGTAAVTTATAATPAVVDPATVTTISNGTKALLFGGAAAVAAPFAAKAMATTPMIDTSAAHTASGHEHAAQAALGKKAAVQQQVAGDAPSQPASALPADRSGLELPDLPEELAATHSKTAATKAGHHAAEHHGHGERRHATEQLRRGASASNSWAEQVGRDAPRSVAPKQRASEFTTQIDQDRAALDAALGEPSR